jgi:hippurate hydrolase
LFDRFGIEEVFGVHNYPGVPIGQFAIRPGPMMASSDTISVDIEGVGGHAARPHFAVDTVLVGAQIVNQLQSVVSRNVDPLHAAVISICMFQAGHANNVIPQHAKLRGTARSLSPKVQDLLQKRVREVVEGTARAYGAKAELTYTTGYPVLVNEERKTAFAASVAREVAGKDKVNTECAPLMGPRISPSCCRSDRARSSTLQRQQRAAAQPGIRLQRRSDSAGTSYWVRLAEIALAG